jgi:hypothetical protein
MQVNIVADDKKSNINVYSGETSVVGISTGKYFTITSALVWAALVGHLTVKLIISV